MPVKYVAEIARAGPAVEAASKYSVVFYVGLWIFRKFNISRYFPEISGNIS